MSTFTNLLFHIIYSTKYRKPIIHPDWQSDLYGYIGGIVRDQKGTLLKIGGVEDHVHLLVKLSPAIAISNVLRTINPILQSGLMSVKTLLESSNGNLDMPRFQSANLRRRLFWITWPIKLNIIARELLKKNFF